MTSLDRIRVPWSGGRGGAGVSTFYAFDGPATLDPIHDFFDAMKSYVSSPITWSFYGSGDTIEAETGVLTGSWSGTGQSDVAATGSDTNAPDPCGLCVNWNTSTILFGHRVRGRTFFVPTIKDAYVGGNINNSVIAAVVAAGAALITAAAGNLQVWSRPFPGTPGWTDVHGRSHPARAAHDGGYAEVLTATCPDKAVVLRSRRA